MCTQYTIIQGDYRLDVHSVLLHTDVFDDQPEQSLFLVEGQVLQTTRHLLAEALEVLSCVLAV